MSIDKISIKVDDDINNDLKDEINEIDNENAIVNDNDVEPYIDKLIIEVSPNGTYLVIYIIQKIIQSLVGMLKIIDINHNQEIELNLGGNDFIGSRHHTFNLKGEFILYSNWKVHYKLFHKEYKIIRIFSTQTKNNKWYGERVYEIPEYFEFINISKYTDKFYLFSNNSIYEWDLDTEKGIKIFYDRELESHYIKRELKHDVKISSNEIFICLRIMDKFIIYSIESAIPIVSLDLNNDNLLYKLVKYSELLLPSLPSLLPLLSSKTQNSIMKYCWKECLNRLGLKDENLQTLPSNVQTTDKYAFGILDGNVWKIKLEENIPKINFSSQNSDVQVIEDINDHFDEYLNINLFKSYMNKIRELFQKVSNSKSEYEGKLKQNDQNLVERIIITDKLLQVWKIKIIDNNKLMLRVFKKADINSKWELIYTRITKFNVSDVRNIKLLEIELFTDDDIILITTIGFLIYHYNENKKTIFLIYWNYMELTTPIVNLISEIPEDFKDLIALLRPYYTLQFNLSLPNYDSFEISDEWISYVKDNKENLLKYGDKLLSFAIKEHKLDLIEEIYKKCINWFKEDLGNNWMFLKLIKPQPSPFVETTMNRDIYNTWNGEAIINFKWNTYGKYYYSIIWIGFIALLGCFTAAATIPQQYIDDDIQKKLLIASIVFGFIHLSFEVRQFIYNPLRWILAEIELFYMLPFQRRWKEWFPEIIYQSFCVRVH
ncbi:hypothetical protein C1646_803737 [Rhizophagus diaphanus]|nr:hypothetical protein C1646_803737 [Rhizophagus diaphanus] [Rhizophagus sp. MUCL 43196]